MSGVGRKPVVGTYRTPRTLYRTVESADSSVDDVTEVINIAVDQAGNPTTRGSNSRLFLFVLLGGPSAATLQLFAKATDESEAGGSSSSSSSPSGSSEWVFHVENATVDAKGLLWVIDLLPAGIYKVVVSSITGSGEVTIRESHTS